MFIRLVDFPKGKLHLRQVIVGAKVVRFEFDDRSEFRLRADWIALLSDPETIAAASPPAT